MSATNPSQNSKLSAPEKLKTKTLAGVDLMVNGKLMALTGKVNEGMFTINPLPDDEEIVSLESLDLRKPRTVETSFTMHFDPTTLDPLPQPTTPSSQEQYAYSPLNPYSQRSSSPGSGTGSRGLLQRMLGIFPSLNEEVIRMIDLDTVKWIDPIPFDITERPTEISFTELGMHVLRERDRQLKKEAIKLDLDWTVGHINMWTEEDKAEVSHISDDGKGFFSRFATPAGETTIRLDVLTFDCIKPFGCPHGDATSKVEHKMIHAQEMAWDGELNPLIRAYGKTRRGVLLPMGLTQGGHTANMHLPVIFWVDNVDRNSSSRPLTHIVTSVPTQQLTESGRTFDGDHIPIYVGTFDTELLEYMELERAIISVVSDVADVVPYSWVCRECGRGLGLMPDTLSRVEIMGNTRCIHCRLDEERTGVDPSGMIPDV